MVYPLSNYKLTLPVNAAGGDFGDAAEVFGLQNYESEWFKQDVVLNGKVQNGFTFICPDGGATTDNAKYPRCELRDLREFSVNDTVSDKIKFKVLECPIDGKIVVHQIHDDDEPWVKVIYLQKSGSARLYARIRQENGGEEITVNLIDNIPLGQSIISNLMPSPGKLRLKVNKQPILTIPMMRYGSGAYFKRGNYFQSNSRLGERAIVAHFKG